MPIAFKSKLSSSVANATFLDKTINDKTIGQFGLENPDTSTHGDIITDAQLEINKSKRSVNAIISDIDNSDQVTLDEIVMTQYLRIQGLLSATTINSLPFGNTITPQDYSEIVLVGQDNTNTVTVEHNDVDYGCLLNGDATLQLGYMLVLIYDDNLKRYIEKSRNF
jgi:hypothetical protein